MLIKLIVQRHRLIMTDTIDLATLLEVPMAEPLEESHVAQILATAPFLPIPQTLNLRRISSPTLRPDIVFRSGALSHLPPASLYQLHSDYNITHVFDLRNRKERAEVPSPEIQGIETVWIPSSADAPIVIESAQKPPKQVLQGINPAIFATNNGVDGYLKMYGNILVTHKEA